MAAATTAPLAPRSRRRPQEFHPSGSSTSLNHREIGVQEIRPLEVVHECHGELRLMLYVSSLLVFIGGIHCSRRRKIERQATHATACGERGSKRVDHSTIKLLHKVRAGHPHLVA